MKHKVSELEGAMLDAAVAKALGRPFYPHTWSGAHAYSGDWAIGGPIVARERIALLPGDGPEWVAGWQASSNDGDDGGFALPQDFRRVAGECWQVGATPLIAAMRAYCSSKFGDEVELP